MAVEVAHPQRKTDGEGEPQHPIEDVRRIYEQSNMLMQV
jgi:hypothetical protein